MSSKVFPSTGEKPKFNPNAAYEAVQESPSPKGSKPAFNPNIKFEVVNEQPQQKVQQRPQEQPKFKSMSDWLAIPQGQPSMTQDVVETGIPKEDFTKVPAQAKIKESTAILVPKKDLTIHSVAQSAERVKEHLQNIDPSVRNLIYSHKKELGGRLKSAQLGINPKEGGPLNPQAATLESNLRQDVIVDPSEVEEYKAGMNDNPGMARVALDQRVKDLSKTNTAQANQLKGDVYMLDAQDRVGKENKIVRNIEKLNKGELDYDTKRGVLFKPEGFFQSIVTAFKQKNQLYSDYELYTKTDNEAAIIKELNEKLKEQDPDEPLVVPDGQLAEAGAMLGGQPIKPIVGAIGAGFATSGLGAAAAGAGISAHEMYKLGYASALPNNYVAIKREHPDMPDYEAYEQAKALSEKQANADALTGAAMGAIGARGALKPSTSLLLQKSVKSALKQIGETVAVEGLGGGAIGGAGQVVKNLMAQKAGIEIDTDQGVAEQLIGGAFMTLAMSIAGKAGKLLKPSTYTKLLHGLSKLPDETISSELNRAQEIGALTPEELQNIQTALKEQKTIDASIKPNVPESDRVKVQELIKERNELDTNLEIEDKAYQADTKEQIKGLNERINGISKGSERGDLQKLIDKEHKEGNIDGFVTETLRDASENDLKKYFKEISEQAHDPNSEATTMATFGENIVNKAKELYPAPKESTVSITYPKKAGKETTVDGVTVIKPETEQTKGISVIQPGEIKHPETITIKPIEDAIPNEAIGTQEIGGQAEVQDITVGQQWVKEPPLPPSESKGAYVERPETQLSFRGLQETANEFGFEDVKSRDRVTDIQERKNAEVTANEWAAKGEYQKNVDDLLNRIENKEHVPTAKQRLILEQYLANEKQKLRETPKSTTEYDVQLAKVKRIKDIGQIARSEAGAALRLPDDGTRVHPISDEVDAMAAKMEANKVDKLTDQQKAEVESQVEKYKQRDEAAQAKIAELEAQVTKMDSQKEFNKVKSSTKRVKKTAEERAAFRRTEIEAAREALRKLRSGESGLSAVPLFGVRELMAIAPHVKNIMVDLVVQGVDNLQDVVKHLHTEFKDVLDGLTEKNIHDIIAGEYNEKGRSLSELQRQIRDLQEEAKLINQVEALENGVAPKSEKAKRERNQKIKALRAKIKDLKVQDGAEELRAIKKRNEAQEKKIKEKIEKGEFEKETKKSIFDREDVKKNHPKLRKEALDAIAKKEDAQHEFDLALFNDEMRQREWYQKLGGGAAKVIHTSKAIMSGIDDSATFVQNGLVMLANPKIGAKAWLRHAKDAFNDARFKRELAALHHRPDWEIIKNSGLDIVEPHSAASKQVEEAFEQNLLAGKIKIEGGEFQPWKYTGGIFERAFTSMGNNMRLLLFEKQMAALNDAGKTFESHPKEFKDAARVINELTGRGKLPAGIAQASPYITPFIWAPRMLTSTINTLGLGEIMALGGKGYYQNLTPMQRKFALSQLGRGVGIGVALMGAAAFGGAKVDYDPRSVTFGDVIIGDHHYNVFGRYVPVIKALVQVASGTRIKGSGQEQDLDSGKWGAKTRLDVVGGFFRGKTTPAFGAALNLVEGRNYFTNEDFTVKDLPEALLQPMVVKELREGWENDGTWTLLNRLLPAFEGIKTSDERDFKKKEEPKQSNTRGRTTRTNPHQKN